MIAIDGGRCHQSLAERTKQSLGFDPTKDYDAWREEIREKFLELVGIPYIEENACPLHMEIESDEMMDGYRRIRFVFESEIDTFVPCYLLIPNTGKERYPVAITLQGHSTGFHYSIGVMKYERTLTISLAVRLAFKRWRADLPRFVLNSVRWARESLLSRDLIADLRRPRPFCLAERSLVSVSGISVVPLICLQTYRNAILTRS